MPEKNVIGREMIAFRVPVDLAVKLDSLAQQTDRTRSSVLRQLLRLASAEQPDLRLGGKSEGMQT